MNTWLKIIATIVVVLVASIIRVILAENGILLGGLGSVLVYGVILIVPITLIWKKRGGKKD